MCARNATSDAGGASPPSSSTNCSRDITAGDVRIRSSSMRNPDGVRVRFDPARVTVVLDVNFQIRHAEELRNPADLAFQSRRAAPPVP